MDLSLQTGLPAGDVLWSPGPRHPALALALLRARRPQALLRLAASAAGGARLRSPKHPRYQLRYTRKYESVFAN